MTRWPFRAIKYDSIFIKYVPPKHHLLPPLPPTALPRRKVTVVRDKTNKSRFCQLDGVDDGGNSDESDERFDTFNPIPLVCQGCDNYRIDILSSVHKSQDHKKVCIDGLQLNLSGSMVIGGNPAITHLPTDFLT